MLLRFVLVNLPLLLIQCERSTACIWVTRLFKMFRRVLHHPSGSSREMVSCALTSSLFTCSFPVCMKRFWTYLFISKYTWNGMLLFAKSVWCFLMYFNVKQIQCFQNVVVSVARRCLLFCEGSHLSFNETVFACTFVCLMLVKFPFAAQSCFDAVFSGTVGTVCEREWWRQSYRGFWLKRCNQLPFFILVHLDGIRDDCTRIWNCFLKWLLKKNKQLWNQMFCLFGFYFSVFCFSSTQMHA